MLINIFPLEIIVVKHRVPTISENQGKIFSSGKSGNFNIFCRESGKVREFWSGTGEPNSVVFLDIFLWNPLFISTKFFLASPGCLCDTCQIRAARSGKVREFKSSWPVGNLKQEICYHELLFKGYKGGGFCWGKYGICLGEVWVGRKFDIYSKLSDTHEWHQNRGGCNGCREQEDRVDSFPPIGGFPQIFHGFLTPLRSVQIWGGSKPICWGGYAFYKHPKLPQNGQNRRFQPRKFISEIHPVGCWKP